MWDDVFKSLNGRLIVIGKAKVVMQNSAKIDAFLFLPVQSLNILRIFSLCCFVIKATFWRNGDQANFY